MNAPTVLTDFDVIRGLAETVAVDTAGRDLARHQVGTLFRSLPGHGVCYLTSCIGFTFSDSLAPAFTSFWFFVCDHQRLRVTEKPVTAQEAKAVT